MWLPTKWWGWHLNSGSLAPKPTLFTATHTYSFLYRENREGTSNSWTYSNQVCWVKRGVLVLLNRRLWNLIGINLGFCSQGYWRHHSLASQPMQLETEQGVKSKKLPWVCMILPATSWCLSRCLPKSHFLTELGGKSRCFPLWICLVSWYLHYNWQAPFSATRLSQSPGASTAFLSIQDIYATHFPNS